MTAQELFNLGVQFSSEGRNELAMELWNKATKLDPNFGPAYVNLHNIYRSQGNLPLAREMLVKFLNCPVNGFTIDSLPKIKQELAELDKQLQAMQQPVQVSK